MQQVQSSEPANADALSAEIAGANRQSTK